METRKYGLFISTSKSYDEALDATKAALKEQGFGVLTEIDVKATLKEKLDADFRRYDIIGACNPPFAHRTLSAELEIGLLLPCNVIVYENDGGGSTVAAIDPETMIGLSGNEAIREIAGEVRERLMKALAAVEG